MKPFEIFCPCPPGLEPFLQAEALEKGFTGAEAIPGGIRFMGLWPNVMRANLHLRGATRVLARIARKEVHNLSQLERVARDITWRALLRVDVTVKVDAVCKKSKINHGGATKGRLENALRANGLTVASDAPVTVMLRVENNKATFSVDTSGEALHLRGLKQAVGKAPLRESMAALLLRACGFDGKEPVLDPMCGSGTFPLEAADIAAGLAPGRERQFAFEELASFLPDHWSRMTSELNMQETELRFFGSDRDAGAIDGAAANAERAGVTPLCQFQCLPLKELHRPDGPPGLVMVNPPYGARIGNRKTLFGLYAGFGTLMQERFSGWRVGLITTDPGLAKATGLIWRDISTPIPHGGLKIQLYQADL